MLASLLAVQLLAGANDTPYRQPQVATDGRTMTVAFGSGNAVYSANWTPAGFSAPVKVASADFLALGRHRGPRVVATPESIVVSAIVGRTRGTDGDIVAWRSTDGGKTWASGVRVNDVAGAAREGLHTMSYHSGILFSAWLDLREKGTRIYSSFSTDDGQTWSPNRLVYASPSGSVCECCHPTAVVGPAGMVAVLFRNSLQGSRDMYLVSSRDGGKTFNPAQKLGRGTWPINACPMDGGGLAVDATGEVVSIWRRDKQVFLARPGETERLLGTGKDPSVAVTKKGIYAAWTSGTAVVAISPGKIQPVTLDTKGGFAQIVALPAGSILAIWEAPNGIASAELE